MDAHTKFDINQAFVANSQDVTKIWKILEDNGMVVEATASCSDKLVRHFQDIEMLTKYENPQRSSIITLEISGRCGEPYETAEILLGAHYSAPVFISLRGEEDRILSMRMAITDTLAGMKPWYSRISTIDLFYVGFSFFIFLNLLMFLLMMMTPSNTPNPAISFTKALSILALLVFIFGLIVSTAFGVFWTRKRFFPTNTFAIGQGLARYQNLEQIRWVVIIGFIVSFVASIIVTLLLSV